MLTSSCTHLLEAFDNVDANGILSFHMPARYMGPSVPTERTARDRHLLESFFFQQELAILKVKLVRSFLSEAIIDSTLDISGCTMRINFAKLMLLPGIEPAAELAELRKFFEQIKNHFEAEPSKSTQVIITNEKDSHGKVIGKLFVNRQDDTVHVDESSQIALNELIEGSPVLKGYIRQLALTMSKMGPHSWTHINESLLYPGGQGPHSDWLYAKRLERSVQSQ